MNMTFPAELQKQFIQMLNKNGISYSSGWSNYMETVKNPAALVLEIKNDKQISMVMKAIKELNKDRNPQNKITVRATAGWTDTKKCKCFCLFGWDKEQEEQYNEGFSFSQVVGGRASVDTAGTDVIIRFAKSYQYTKVLGTMKNPPVVNPKNPIHQLPVSLVEVSAGVQISELADFLRKHKLSLTTASMIAWVSAVGLAGTAGHGTGRDEPAFSGLIESIKICDAEGNIRELTRDDPDFANLVGGHSGLLGVVLSMKIRAVKAFNLEESIELYSDTKEMSGKLAGVLKNNQYVSIMGMPSYSCPETGKLVSKWQIRKWNYTTEKPTTRENAPYAPDISSFAQELQVRIGSSVMEYLLDSGLKHLMPAFMLLSAAVVTGTRGTARKVDFENHISHPQVAFPKAMRDVSYLIPVKDADAGKVLEETLQKMESLLNKAGSKGEYPVTYAIYVRYIKGTNGGLSTSYTHSEDERILAIDVVTHPDAPGIDNFERNMMSYFRSKGISPRNHLGKNFPAEVQSYEQFFGPKIIQDYMESLQRWYSSPDKKDGPEKLAMSPFFTPYLQNMLSPSPSPKEELEQKEDSEKVPVNINRAMTSQEHSESELLDFLTKLHAEISKMDIKSDEGKSAKENFLSVCQLELERMNIKQSSATTLH